VGLPGSLNTACLAPRLDAFSTCAFDLQCTATPALQCRPRPPPFACDAQQDLLVIGADDVPLAIPDVGGVDSVVTVADSRPVARVVLLIDEVDHGFIPDLTVGLSHGGEQATVATFGAFGANLRRLVLDDDCPASLTTGQAPHRGCFQPASPLSAWSGNTAAGTWTVRVTDGVAADSGTLRSWRLGLCLPRP